MELTLKPLDWNTESTRIMRKLVRNFVDWKYDAKYPELLKAAILKAGEGTIVDRFLKESDDLKNVSDDYKTKGYVAQIVRSLVENPMLTPE